MLWGRGAGHLGLEDVLYVWFQSRYGDVKCVSGWRGYVAD